jgi:hypothetical protein
LERSRVCSAPQEVLRCARDKCSHRQHALFKPTALV